MSLPPYPVLWRDCMATGGHEPYTHRHHGEPDVTYCLTCRVSL